MVFFKHTCFWVDQVLVTCVFVPRLGSHWLMRGLFSFMFSTFSFSIKILFSFALGLVQSVKFGLFGFCFLFVCLVYRNLLNFMVN